MREGTVAANGVRYAYLEEGEGSLVLLLHGFPDNAHTWSHQMPALAAAGYRAVAPFLRGYPPTEIPSDGFFDSGTLATDVRALIDALGGSPAFVVGHDWGAAITYYLLSAFPSAVRRAVTLAIPHPAVMLKLLEMPNQIHHAFHFWFFQLPIAEEAITANDFAFIDYLWRMWSPGHEDAAHIDSVKRTLATPGALSAALGYYRSMLDPSAGNPEAAEARQAIGEPIAVPTLTLLGSNDPRSVFVPDQKELFSGPSRADVLEGCGHFLHRERPQEVSRLILEWLAER